jgi:hypothetical protein
MIETVQPPRAEAKVLPLRLGRAAFVAAAILLTVLAAGQARRLYGLYLSQDRLPLWDMAGHAWGGIELHQALRQGRPLHFLGLLNAQDKWPFGFSLLLLPFVGLSGDGFAAATLLSAALFALIPLLLLWAAREVDGGAVGWWSGFLAALLFLESPLPRLFAVLIMREEAGMFLSLLAFCAYLRAGLAGLALFLVKYNYALIWGVAVAADGFLRLSPERRAGLLRRTGRRLWPWGAPGSPPAAGIVALYLWALAAAVLLGQNPGYGVYAGLLAATVWATARWRRDPEGVAAWWRSLPAAGRALAATVALPLWIWFLSPSPVHPKEILAFLRNRSTGPPVASLDSLLYYPGAFVRDYAPVPLGGVVLALLALALVVRWIGFRPLAGGEAGRVLLLTVGLSFLLPTLHPYKEPRFLATAVPFALLAATALAGRLAHSLAPDRWRAATGATLCALMALGIWTAPGSRGQEARLLREYEHHSSDPAFRAPLDFIAAAGRGASGKLAVLGSFNELSENLVRCRLAQAGGPEVARPLARFRDLPPPAAVAGRVRGWLQREQAGRVAALRLLPASPLFASEDYRAYNAWQLGAIAAIEGDADWRIVERRLFPAAGLEVVVFARGRRGTSGIPETAGTKNTPVPGVSAVPGVPDVPFPRYRLPIVITYVPRMS